MSTTNPSKTFKRAVVTAATLALISATSAATAGTQLWQRMLRWMSGTTSATPVQTTMLGKHMQLSVRQPLQAGDEQRAAAILAGARSAVEKYRNVADAERDGYRPFMANGQIGEEVHYTHLWRAAGEKRSVDPSQPSSLLYRRTQAGLQIVGVMYTAPPDAKPEELDARVPLSTGVWHRHVHFCGAPDDAPRSESEGPSPRFGFFGSIDDETTCKQAGGYWIPLAFGWMTHVYPNGKTRDDIWFGKQMLAAEAGLTGYVCTTAPDE